MITRCQGLFLAKAVLGSTTLLVAQGGAFSAERLITNTADAAVSVYAADLDGDGDLDVLSASAWDDTIAWFDNTDGLGTFGPKRIITTIADGAYEVCAADVDGDGDLDALSSSLTDSKIAWYENTDGLGTFGPQLVITTATLGARGVCAADVDGDGDVDVLSASFHDDKIAWYENTDGLGTFGPQVVITTTADGARRVRAVDIDGDGDVDVLSASELDDRIAWYENTDGLGTFGPQQVITATADLARDVVGADVDGDGDIDVLTASQLDNTIAWFENTDGLGAFGPQQVISTSAVGANGVYATDVDGDGDADVLSASADGVIAWYENTDALGTFGPQQVITATASNAIGVFASDLDDDGDADVLSASANDDKIAWYENLRTAHLGTGCAGLVLRADAPMRVGAASTVTMDNVPAVSPFGLFMLGSQALPSPFALNSACTAYILPNLTYHLMLPVLGRAQLTIPVPNDAALVGVQLGVQGTARSLDPSAWRSRFAVSNGLLYTIEN